MHLYHLVERAATEYPRKTFIKYEKESITFRQLQDHSLSLAHLLFKKGVRPGTHVAVLMDNHPDYITALFAIMRLNAVFVPINNFLKGEEIEYILKDSETRLLICSSRFSRLAATVQKHGVNILYGGKDSAEKQPNIHDTPANTETLPRLSEDERSLAFLLYTSGTTGHPKGVMLSHNNLVSNLRSIKGAFGDFLHSRRRFLLFLPLFHTFPLTANLLLPLFLGCTLRLFPGVRPFRPIMRSLLTEGMDVFIAVPAIYSVLSKAKIPWYVRLFLGKKIYISGGSPLAEETFHSINRKLPGMVLEGYGLSECSPVVSFNPPDKSKVRSVGPPLPEVEVKVVDDDLCELPCNVEGELIVRGPNVMEGYYGNPQESAQALHNGWLRTGDIARIDEDGYIFIVDRLKDLIISKGMNIYPREVEEVLYKHEGVEHAAVLGLPDKQLEEIPVAFIVKSSEYRGHLDEVVLKKYLRPHIANYKIPRQFHFIDDIPLNATGKVMKRELREQIQAAMDYLRDQHDSSADNSETRAEPPPLVEQTQLLEATREESEKKHET
ncbi:long-chain-fatty-acid--CoA ligase [Desulfurispira natronophila]|uniref:Long-chain-fatty-acid--CoA ligase n=1 Tax=Desulfurispira natronophila TaxID=682562 RepID=A0A7W8DHI1_9BACT|nr:long-chain-fatty-acid--CoA ligase [Desulfurispira natronophila]MBB5022591.1 long-chain acyl-CoA synthetase [Desulfurispira natronophila]